MSYFSFVLDVANDPIFYYFFMASNLVALICWLATLLTDNYSHVDRLWSILPAIYAWGFLFTAVRYNGAYSVLPGDFSSQLRLLVICVLISLWGARLSYNFWRKGGYSLKEEDYRWVHVRKMFNYPEKKLVFHLFNFGFTAFIQNWLLLGLAVPIWYIQSNPTMKRQESYNVLDILLAVVFLVLLSIEYTADEQQWTFQSRKHRWLADPRSGKYSLKEISDFKRGFLVDGLFKYSRHPNFFAEVLMWWTVYAFTISAQLNRLNAPGGFHALSLLNYSILAPAILTWLFHGSTNLTERISTSKYKEYKEYQAQVSRIIPWFGSYKSKQA
jgi:steroid 5-alpha reductase family enzyme